jgi:hypothetical protein
MPLCKIEVLLYKAIFSLVASSHPEAQHMSPGQTPKLQAVLKSRGLSVLAAHAMERPTQGGFSRATKPHFDCCLLLTKKKKDLSLHIKFQPWMNTGLVGLWLVSLTMFLTTENLIYIHIYIYIYISQEYAF